MALCLGQVFLAQTLCPWDVSNQLYQERNDPKICRFRHTYTNMDVENAAAR